MEYESSEINEADWAFQAANSISAVHENDLYEDAKSTGNLGAALSRAVLVYTSVRDIGKTGKAKRGNNLSVEAIRAHTNKYGQLSPEAVYYLIKLSEACSYPEIASRLGRESIKLHRSNTKRTDFIKWATKHITDGAKPRNVAAIKRLSGFDKKWGTDDTVKKWWRSIDNAPTLKPGATRT